MKSATTKISTAVLITAVLLLATCSAAPMDKASQERLPRTSPQSPKFKKSQRPPQELVTIFKLTGPPAEQASSSKDTRSNKESSSSQLHEHEYSSLNALVKAFDTVVLYVTDAAAVCGRECGHFQQHFVRVASRLEEEGFGLGAGTVAYAHLHGPENREEFHRVKQLVEVGTARGKGKFTLPILLVLVNHTVLAIDNLQDDANTGSKGDPSYFSEYHWISGTHSAVLEKYRRDQQQTAKKLKTIMGIDNYQKMAIAVFPVDEFLSEELPAFVHRYAGPPVKNVSKEFQLRFRIGEAQHSDKISFVLWEPPADTPLSPAEEGRRRMLQSAFYTYAARNRLRAPFSITQFRSALEHRKMAFHYNKYRHDVVAYLQDREAQDATGFRPEGLNFTGATAKDALKAIGEWVEVVQRERHTPRRSSLQEDLAELQKKGSYNASKYFRSVTFYEPQEACKTRRVVPGDTIVVVMHGRSLTSAAEFLKWGSPGVVLTVGTGGGGLPKLLHQAFLGMCRGMKRQVIVPKPADSPSNSVFSHNLLQEGDTFGIELIGFLNEPKLTFEQQKNFDATSAINRWRMEEIEQWNRVEERIRKKNSQQSLWMP